MTTQEKRNFIKTKFELLYLSGATPKEAVDFFLKDGRFSFDEVQDAALEMLAEMEED